MNNLNQSENFNQQQGFYNPNQQNTGFYNPNQQVKNENTGNSDFNQQVTNQNQNQGFFNPNQQNTQNFYNPNQPQNNQNNVVTNSYENQGSFYNPNQNQGFVNPNQSISSSNEPGFFYDQNNQMYAPNNQNNVQGTSDNLTPSGGFYNPTTSGNSNFFNPNQKSTTGPPPPSTTGPPPLSNIVEPENLKTISNVIPPTDNSLIPTKMVTPTKSPLNGQNNVFQNPTSTIKPMMTPTQDSTLTTGTTKQQKIDPQQIPSPVVATDDSYMKVVHQTSKQLPPPNSNSRFKFFFFFLTLKVFIVTMEVVLLDFTVQLVQV
jgi:hypothetical protein